MSSRRPCVAYVVSSYPYGSGEPFVRPELQWLQDHAFDVAVVPLRPVGPAPQAGGVPQGAVELTVPLFSLTVALGAARVALRSPRAVARCLSMLLHGGYRVRLKNLAALPKALWLAGRLEALGAIHVHAYWASVPATVAMVAAQVSGIGWSFTGHRWDLLEANLLDRKVASAAFGRVTSAEGLRRVEDRLGGPCPDNVFLARTGVEVPARLGERPARRLPVLLCPALLIDRKDHRTLIQGFAGAVSGGIEAELVLAGGGPTREALEEAVSDLGLKERVTFLGQVDRADLLALYDQQQVDIVVLTSLDEGLPFGLLEAMARGLPVIATDVGGIGELLAEGGGILVPPGDPAAVTRAVKTLVDRPEERALMGRRARQTIVEHYDVDRQASEMASRFSR